MTQEVDNRLLHIERQIIGLEKDRDGQSRLSNRFEQSMEKLTEVTVSMKEMIALHSAEIKRHSEEQSNLYRIISDNRAENIEQHKEIMVAVEKACNNIAQKVDDLDSDLDRRIEILIENDGDKEKRLKLIEKFSYVWIGLAIILGLIADKLPWGALFGLPI